MTDIPMKSISATPDMEAFRTDLLALLNKYTGTLMAEHMLALASQATGQLAALQDQRRFTPAMVLQIVQENFEAGNSMVLAGLNHTKGTA